MKKYFKLLVSVLLLMGLLIGCSTTTPDDEVVDPDPDTDVETPPVTDVVEDGTYEIVVNGHNGLMTLRVVFDGGVIAAVEIVDHSETGVLSDPALDGIPKKIVEFNSVAVDNVAGATVTSAAIKLAVRNAIEEAGGDVDDFNETLVKPDSESKTLQFEVIVVGAGAAGVSAALKAEELGADVVLLEKTGMIGGALVVSGGNQVVMGSQLQIEAGVSDDTVASMVEDFLNNGAHLNDEEMLTIFAENVGTATDWLNQYVGVEFNMEGGLHKLAEYSYDRELAYLGGGAGFMRSTLEKIEESSITLLLGTKATELKVNDEGHVVGVLAEDTDGNSYDITAK